MVIDQKHPLERDRKTFGSDPLGYSASAWIKWGIVQTIAGFPVDVSKPAKSEDLKTPVLWLSQARALSEAAVSVIQNEPEYKGMPVPFHGACDSQYCAVGLMLVGYSLEICLKAMLIMKNGIDGYISVEKKHRHHRLEELAKIVPDLSEKDKAILKALTHFVYWAGRYPDPGSGRDDDSEEIFNISEKYKISAHDLFKLSSRIMSFSEHIANKL
ncbi:MAG: hypothetical protein SVO01_12510 [Thermotogota bacterium]|nr:hypothetical protein [Thermotogota bacterium]